MAHYRFRYYGSAPADWAEGANAGHCFTVQFLRVPSADEMRALGEAFAAALRSGRAAPHSETWSERFLKILAGERGKGLSRGEHLGPITKFLGRAHAIVPIEDAVYENAREGSDPWSAWSLAQRPPDPGPAPGTARFALYQRSVDESLPPYREVAAFEEGKALENERSRRVRLEREVAKGADGLVHLVRVDDVAPARLEQGPGEFGHRLLSGDEDAVKRARDVMSTIDPSSKESTWGSAVLAHGDRLAVSTSARLLVVDVAATPQRVVYQAKTPRRKIRAVLDGRALLARKLEGDSVHVFANDRLVHVASTPVDLPFAFERDGRIFYGFEGFLFELVGLLQAVEQEATKKPKSRAQPKARSTKAAEPISLVKVDAPSAALCERLSFEPSPRAAKYGKAKVGEAPGGAHAVSRPSGRNHRSLIHISASGARTDLSDAVQAHLRETILGLALSPSGRFVFVQTHGRILRVSVDPVAVETVVDTSAPQMRVSLPATPTDDLVVYVDRKQVHWMQRQADGQWSEIGSGKAPSATWVLAATPEIVIVYAKDDLERKKPKYPLRVWRLGTKKPKEVYKSEHLAMRAAHDDGRWYLRDARGDVWELNGLQ